MLSQTSRARAVSLRRSSRSLFLAIAAAVALSGCPLSPTDVSSCGPDGDPTLVEFFTAGEALTSPFLEVSLVGDRRSFSWSRLVENVCSSEHFTARWELTVDNEALPPGWRVDAGYVLGPLFEREVTMTATNSGNRRDYTANADIGLRQLYEGQPGRFLLWLEISFTSQGIDSIDRTVAQRAFRHAALVAHYKVYKGS